MANVTATASDYIIYNTVHGRIIVRPGDQYTIDTAKPYPMQFVSTAKVVPVASTITQN